MTDTDITLTEESTVSKKRTSILTIIKNNPEIPDALRDFAQFVPKEKRRMLLKVAGIADAVNTLSDDGISAMAESEMPNESLYSVMKKYIPMDKRRQIDGMISFAEGFYNKMTPKSPSNKLEDVINKLSRINEASKLVSGVTTFKKIAEISQNGEKKTEPSAILDVFSGLLGADARNKLNDILSGLENKKPM